MFEETKNEFYKSLSESIKNRKKVLNLKREDILFDKTRVSKIVNNTRNEHHPYLISKGEYHYLIYLFQFENHDSFINQKIKDTPEKELKENCNKNYDKMLWGHIDWDKMFRDVLTELSKLNLLEHPEKLKELNELEKLEEKEDFEKLKEFKKMKKPKELKELEKLKEQKKIEQLFKETLIDYAPYALIRNDEFSFEYPQIFISPEEREEKMLKAIIRVHVRNGSELFKQTFLEKFRGKTLHEFDKDFPEFISNYLEKRKPDIHSVGLRAYNFHKIFNEYVISWQTLPEVQYVDKSDEKSELYILLDEFKKFGHEHMKKLEKIQQNYDTLYIDNK